MIKTQRWGKFRLQLKEALGLKGCATITRCTCSLSDFQPDSPDFAGPFCGPSAIWMSPVSPPWTPGSEAAPAP